jgi:hypothetical protein
MEQFIQDHYQLVDIVFKAFVFVSIIIAASQFYTNRRSLLFTVYRDAMEIFDDPETRAARSWVYKMPRNLFNTEKWIEITGPPSEPKGDLPNKSLAEQTDDYEAALVVWHHKQMAERTVRVCDRFGLLIREGKVPVDLLAHFYTTPVLRAWYKLADYIEAVRKDRIQRGHMWEFENLVFDIILPAAERGTGTWKHVKEHENLETYIEHKDAEPINLLALQRPAYRFDKYVPNENLWYLGTFQQLGYTFRRAIRHFTKRPVA